MNPFQAIERFGIFFTAKYLPFHLKSFKILIAVAPLLIAAFVLILGWMSTQDVREVVSEEFNKQQLVLAQHAANQIENNLSMLKSELSYLSLSPVIQYHDQASLSRRIQISYDRIREKGALGIHYFDASGEQTHIFDAAGYRIVASSSEGAEYLRWGSLPENRETILTGSGDEEGRGHEENFDPDARKLLLTLAIPVWQVSIDESNPVATNTFSGVIVFLIDTTALIKRIAKDIRSGQTGYAWVIDSKGMFLYHPVTIFIGKSAFEARQEKRPTISFTRINEIQKSRMLKGEEGMSWYITGWHAGREGEIKKLIAYAPIRLHAVSGWQTWSVAVVAPISEVEETIHGIQVRQLLLQGIILLTILAGSLLLIGITLKWSSSLTREVEKISRELIKSESQCKLLVENANDIIFTVNRDGMITSINKAGFLFFSNGEREIVGREIGEICFNEQSSTLQYQAIDQVFSTGEAQQLFYPLILRGTEHWVSTNFSPVKDEEGRSTMVIGIMRDITESKRKEQKEQMYHTEKLASMGTLAAGVAHEINNPLGIILGFTELLLERTPAGVPEHDMLETIEKHGLNAKRVVENLLSFARYSDHSEEKVHVNASIKTILDVVKNTLLLNQISLKEELEDAIPPVKGDPQELQQVFLNIINNAIYAMKGGGTLTVTTRARKESNEVEIRFADTGPGIAEENRGRIFDPLFTTKKVGEGTGLGLSVSYGIVTKHGGTITFETSASKASGATGTAFIIRLQSEKQNGENND